MDYGFFTQEMNVFPDIVSNEKISKLSSLSRLDKINTYQMGKPTYLFIEVTDVGLSISALNDNGFQPSY